MTTKEILETAVREGLPFVIRMADGREYPIASQQHIMVGKHHVVFMDKRTVPHVLPLLTVTGVKYQEPRKKKKI